MLITREVTVVIKIKVSGQVESLPDFSLSPEEEKKIREAAWFQIWDGSDPSNPPAGTTFSIAPPVETE